MNRRQLLLRLGALTGLAQLSNAAWAGSFKAFSATLIVDLISGKALRREGPVDRRLSPCSTFKVPLAAMGFDSGILIDATHPSWPYRPEFGTFQSGHKRVNPTEWERHSIVWYSKEITRKLGMEKFQAYINSLNYGNKDLSGGLTEAWLCNSLLISAEEQVRLVRGLCLGHLPVKAEAQKLARAILPRFVSASGWKVQGKTGSGWLKGSDRQLDKSRPLGWFIGVAEKDGHQVVFAHTEVGAEAIKDYGGLRARENLLKSFLP